MRAKPVHTQLLNLVVSLILAVAALAVLLPAPARAQTPSGPGISVSTSQSAVAEGGLATFTVRRSGTSLSQELTVKVRTWEANRRDTQGNFFDEQVHTVTFAPGRNLAEFHVVAYVDDLVEPAPGEIILYPHTLNAAVVASDDVTYQLGSPSSASVNITDINAAPYPAPRIQIQDHATALTVDEGDDATLTLVRTGGDTTQTLTVDILVDDPNGILRGNDWEPPVELPTQVEFEANATTATVALTPPDDWRRQESH